jgi:predicted dienelactone hydrolase
MKQFRLWFGDALAPLRWQPLLGRTCQSCVAFACLALSLFIMGCSDSDSEAFTLDSPAAASVDAPDAMGPYSVGHVRMEFIDVLRDNRSLPADIWFPAAKADIGDAINTIYPLQGPLGIESIVSFDDVPAAPGERRGLLIFSHGFGGTNTQSTALMEQLASQGFVIVSPEHTGNTNSDRSDPNPAANRVPDVSFIIDSLLALNDSQGDRFFETIDANKIGVLGHSGGGFTSIGAVTGYESTPADARVKAIMPISAAIAGSYSADDLALVSVPVLLMGGTLDTSVPITLNDFAFEALVSAPQVLQVDVVGATHTHFANICDIASWLIENGLTPDLWDSIGAAALTAPYLDTCSEDAFPIGRVLRLQNLYATAFFRYHLNGETGYGKFLEQGYAESELDIKFKSR